MKKMILAAALSLLATAAFAGGATLEGRESKSNGSATGESSSSYTGNGDYIGGNGTSGVDQTTSPASRAEAKVAAGVMNGNANGLSKK
ncbi:hypothetical protein QO002_005593 [Pararhizobium capsulatum DSM 1112]|uniref:Uncharacterized protein n=1 Tax=Pararhizobium capsulatum DSM 1112 TaxID=1121113 RepID=A0ABU0BZJ5_9HYPH|nr:hypothetical protein [Pararhizobium capsulatum]MDQ0323387.1 hypothetical protein [Pararhizobium capsulatum DSM 1112]